MTAVNPAVDPEGGLGPPPEYDPTRNMQPAPAYTNEPPPSYNSVMAEIRRAKQESDGNADFAKKLGNVCGAILCGTAAVMFMVGLGLAIPIADIVMGAIYLHDCPAERMIPIYLIVSGCFILLRTFITIGDAIHKKKSNKSEEEYKRPTVSKCLEGPLDMFLCSWFIAGSVWVFGLKNHNTSDPTQKNYCNNTLYLYAFWIIMVGYIFVGLLVLFCCIFCCIVCCWGMIKGNSESND